MVRLIGQLYVVSGNKLTHPWDASAYFIAGEEPTLIDCGSSTGYPFLKQNLKQLGYEPKDIRQVIATHGHWDHLSGMAQLREESDARLLLHAADRAGVEQGDSERTAAFLYDKSFTPVQVDRTIEDGDLLTAGSYQLHVYHTPGHSPGSVSLWVEINGLKLLIAGDTLYGGYHPRIGSDLEQWRRSLDRLVALDVDVLTIGHSPPSLIFDAKTHIEEARQQFGVYFNPWFKPFHTSFRY
jgi:glyoxylase-like metal-dependent hydrolase (beta-lactamase superfamily II)